VQVLLSGEDFLAGLHIVFDQFFRTFDDFTAEPG
jgi:hypothetical protein